MERHVVRLLEQVRQIGRRAVPVHPELGEVYVRRREDVDRDHAHREGARPHRELSGARAQPHEPERRSVQLVGHRQVHRAVAEVAVGLVGLLRHVEHQVHRVLRQRDRAERSGRIRQRDVLLEDVLDVGVVEPRAENLPELHPRGGPGVDDGTTCVAALVDDNTYPLELGRDLLARIEHGELRLVAKRGSNVIEPRLLGACLGQEQCLHNWRVHPSSYETVEMLRAAQTGAAPGLTRPAGAVPASSSSRLRTTASSVFPTPPRVNVAA